jgi:drug/metabolite transporter (DMT)-like permease
MWEAILLLAAATLAASHIVGKLAMRELSLGAFLTARAGAALLCTLPWIIGFEWPGWRWQTHAWIAASVLLSPLGLTALFFAGLRAGSVASMNAVMRSSPVFVVLLSWCVAGRVPGAFELIGCAVILIGCGLLGWATRSGGELLALGLGFLAAAGHAGSLLLQVRVLQLIDAEQLIVCQNVALLPFAIVVWRLTDARAPRPRPVTPRRHRLSVAVGLAAASGLMVQVLFDWLKYLAMPQTGAVVAACLLLMSVPLALGLAWCTLAERPTRAQVAGVGLVVAGAVVVTLVSG